jgi:hypothetical protein
VQTETPPCQQAKADTIYQPSWLPLLKTASSGKTTGRHRLNPAGDRQANHALWRIAFTRMGSHPPTRVYVERRLKEGLSKPEIMRCLKRYIAREVYPHLRPLTN